MVFILSFLIVCFFTLLGILIGKLMSTKKVSVMERLRTSGADNAVLKSQEDEGYLQKLDKMLVASRTGVTPPVYIAILIVSAVIIYLVCNFLTDSVIVGVIAAFASLLVPRYIIDIIAKRNKALFDSMFVKALKRLSASLRAGGSLQQAIADVADSESMPVLIRQEFAQTLADYQFSGDMYAAFMDMYARTADNDVKGVAIGIKISSEYGSDLSQIFDTYANMILTRKEMNEEGKAILASTKMNTIIVACVPFVFGLAMKFLQPDYFDYAYNWLGGIGRYIIVALYMIDIAGFLYLNKKCDINID